MFLPLLHGPLMVWIWNPIRTQSFEECIRWSDQGSGFPSFGKSNVEIPAVTLVSFFSWSAQEASSCCNLACRKERRLVIQQSENQRGPHSEMLSRRWLEYIRPDCRCLFDGGAKPSSILCSCLGTCFSKLLTSSIHQCCLHP